MNQYFFQIVHLSLSFLLIAHQLWLFLIVLGEKCLPATSSKNTNRQCWNNHKQSLRKWLLLRLINWWLAMSLGQRCSIKVFKVTVIYHWFPVVCPPVKVFLYRDESILYSFSCSINKVCCFLQHLERLYIYGERYSYCARWKMSWKNYMKLFIYFFFKCSSEDIMEYFHSSHSCSHTNCYWPQKIKPGFSLMHFLGFTGNLNSGGMAVWCKGADENSPHRKTPHRLTVE